MHEQKHKLNEQLKRIEPCSSKCSYCDKGIVSNVNDCYYVPIYKVRERENIIVYSSVTFSKLLLGIPRCHFCKQIHDKAQKKAFLFSLVVAVAVLIYAVYSFLDIPVVISIFLLLLSGAAGFGGYVYLEDRFAINADCMPKHRGPEKDDLIKEFRKGGWILGKPAAR